VLLRECITSNMLSILRGSRLVSNLSCFFKFANLKQNFSGYPSAMILSDTCARNAHTIADLFGEYFQGV
jgi:hypothetical protein